MASPASFPNASFVDLAHYHQSLAVRYRVWIVGLVALTYAFLVWAVLPTLGVPAKLVMTAFGLAAILWATTTLNSTYVALAAALTCSLAMIESHAQIGFSALADDTILLIIGAFVLASAINATGISKTLIDRVVALAPTLTSLCFLICSLVLALSFVIPSTSGRAALLVPTFLALRHQLAHAGAVRAVAILIPAIIVLSSSATLISSGGNLIAVETLARLTGDKIDYADWLIVHLPLSIMSCFLTTWFILCVFVDRRDRSMKLRELLRQHDPSTGTEDSTQSSTSSTLFVFVIIAGVLATWISQEWHGIPAGMTALIGALLVTLPGIGPVGFKTAVKSIDWSLVLFLAASLQIGLAVVDSGVADWAAGSVLSPAAHSPITSETAIILIAIVSLFGHFVITSRTARTAAFLPPILLVALSYGLDPIAVTHMTAAALGYCLTLVVGSKAIVIFSELGGTNFSQRDLLKLACYLIPLHLLLLMVFTFFVWPSFGVTVFDSHPVVSIILPLPTH